MNLEEFKKRLIKNAAANVTPIRQPTQYHCVPTSLAMALLALGVRKEECLPEIVNKVLGALPLRGASFEQVSAAASHYGMRTTLVTPSTLRQVKEWTDMGKPVMIGWNPENREWSHASLIFDVQEQDDGTLKVFVADPNIPNPEKLVRVIEEDEFYSKWYEKATPGYLIRRPAMCIEREITPDGKQVMR
jgi:hypothetical protein